MPANALQSAKHTIHIHSSEISTERDSLAGYFGMFMLLLAITAFFAAVWVTMLPRANSYLIIPSPFAPQTKKLTQTGSAKYDVVSPNVNAAKYTVVQTS